MIVSLACLLGVRLSAADSSPLCEQKADVLWGKDRGLLTLRAHCIVGKRQGRRISVSTGDARTDVGTTDPTGSVTFLYTVTGASAVANSPGLALLELDEVPIQKLDIAPLRRFWANKAAIAAEKALAEGDYEVAESYARKAASLGLDTTELVKGIAVQKNGGAPTRDVDTNYSLQNPRWLDTSNLEDPENAPVIAERRRKLEAEDRNRAAQIKRLVAKAYQEVRSKNYSQATVDATDLRALGAITDADLISREVEREQSRQQESRWRSRIATCRGINDTLRQLKALRSCDASCREVLKRVSARVEGLKEALGVEFLSQGTKARLQSECESARCPVCPEATQAKARRKDEPLNPYSGSALDD